MARDVSNTPRPTAVALPSDIKGMLKAGLAESRATTIIAGGGKPFLRMSKAGKWIHGPENLEVEADSRWVVNVLSIEHGYCCWVDGGKDKNELKGEIMVPVSQPKPLKPPPIDGTPFAEQRAFNLKCLDGADEGIEVTYKTASVGGMKAADGLFAAIMKQLDDRPEYPCPVLDLGHTSYDHKKWGETFTPVLTVVGWADMNGALDDGGEVTEAEMEAEVDRRVAEVEAAPAPEPARKRNTQRPEPSPARNGGRKASAAPAEKPEPTPAPVSTVQAHTGQRRRPGASAR